MKKRDFKIPNSNFKIPAQIIGLAVLLLFLLPFVADAATLRTPPNNLGLVGYWSFEDGSGSTATDFSGNGNDGTLTNMDQATDWVSGKRGSALDFDGNNDVVQIPASETFNLTNITVSFWVKYENWGAQGDSNEWNSPLDTRAENGTHIFSFEANDDIGNDLEVKVNNPDGTDPNTVVKSNMNQEVGSWRHVAMTYDGSTLRTYYQGELQNSTTGNMVPDASGGFKFGGRGSSGVQLDGLVDEARIYNRALSASEVKDLYNSGYAQVNTSRKLDEIGGLVGWWTFDGKDMINGVEDSSGNGNDGYFNGGATSSAKTSGRLGQALEFDGSDDYVQISSDPVFDQSRTWSLWLRTDGNWRTDGGSSKDTSMLIGRHDSGGSKNGVNVNLNPNTSDGTVGVQLKDSNGTVCDIGGTDDLTDSQWHFVTVAFSQANGGQANLFVDGNLEDSCTNSASWSFNNQDVLIADSTDSFWEQFGGSIDDIRVYDQKLSPGQIQRIYNATRPSTVNTSRNNRLTNGLVGMWSFDGPSMDFSTSPPTAEDVSSNSNTGTLQNGPTDAIGNIGQALEFDGSDDYVDAGDDSSLDITGNITISFWANFDDASDDDGGVAIRGLVNKGRGAKKGYWTFYEPDNDEVMFETNDSTDTYYNVAAPLSDNEVNEWHHFVATYDGSQMQMYKDGMLENSTSYSNGFQTTGNSLKIANLNGGFDDFLDGKIDNIRVYDRALSSDEIERLYNLGR